MGYKKMSADELREYNREAQRKSRERTKNGEPPVIKRRLWSPSETDTARRLLVAGAMDEVFRSELGRSRQSAVNHLKYSDSPAERAKVAARVRKQNMGDAVNHPQVGSSAKVPPGLLEDAMRRRCAEMPLTAALMGDPAPGQSALDKIRAQV